MIVWCAECQLGRALDLGHDCPGFVLVAGQQVACACTDPHPPAGDVALASVIEELHRNGRACHQCGPAGCELRDWSRPRVEAFRRELAARRR
ncbi:hypothetical protein [Micromonospora costi]|uniref:Uncharacterized protein n=1 Tax=Micromonospora costi TaxID=1530042 RepID=A0A3B0A5D3_9ACTN|nr:hypothetical protein [Micromonospora costi]RKN55968.1 hypothetical protein D7193_15390 [Micromonospora costi]